MSNSIEISFHNSVEMTIVEKKFFSKLKIIFEKICSDFLSDKLTINNKFIMISFNLCGDYKIKKLNTSFRNKNKRTDVLSFSLFEDLRKEKLISIPAINLGDVFICKNVALKQAKESAISWRIEYLHLWIHGFLHLSGYDHERSNKDETEMFDLEKKLVKKCLKEII